MAIGPTGDVRAVGSRVVIVGASGSGKSTLAGVLGARMAIEVIDLDRIHWLGKVGVKRDEGDARQMVSAHAARPSWIIEGVFGWLADVALPRATSLVWLDLPWSACREGLAARGPWPAPVQRSMPTFLRGPRITGAARRRVRSTAISRCSRRSMGRNGGCGRGLRRLIGCPTGLDDHDDVFYIIVMISNIIYTFSDMEIER